jgi:hypothetical protein
MMGAERSSAGHWGDAWGIYAGMHGRKCVTRIHDGVLKQVQHDIGGDAGRIYAGMQRVNA